MAKTISVAQLGHGGASRAIRDAQNEPVLVSKENRPAAWIVGVERLAEVAAARGVELDVYENAMDLLAVELYDNETLSLGQAAKLTGRSLHDFMSLCGRLNVSVLWEPPGGIRSEVDALKEALHRQTTAV